MSKKSSNPKVHIKESRIHGLGLFAAKKINKGEVIDKLTGRLTKKDGPHVLWLNEQDGFKVECHMKYINHSAKPNAVYYDDLTVVALKTIKPGEEITHYYGEGWD